MNTVRALQEKIRAGYPALYLQSVEDIRSQRDIKVAAMKQKRGLYVWTLEKGMVQDDPEAKKLPTPIDNSESPAAALKAIYDVPKKSVIILRQYHHFLDSPSIQIKLLDLIPHCKDNQKTIIITSAALKMPEEIEKELTLVESSLPTREDLQPALQGIIDGSKLSEAATPKKDQVEAMLSAALGMTTTEAENAFALSYSRAKLDGNENLWDHRVVLEEKCMALRKSGLLEYIPAPEGGLTAIGGMQHLKEWVRKRKRMFGEEAKKFGLQAPKGILLVGPPGSGKSAGARAISGEMGLPLLKCDMGKMFGSLVGQSEANIRNAIKTAEAISPCILWIDEIEKGLAGSGGSGATDSGVGARVLGTLLTWMQEKTTPVFVYATANDVTGLPPELLRKGRFDEMFSVMLPAEEEREEILKIHLAKRGRGHLKLNLKMLLDEKTEGFSGAELESIVNEGLIAAFDEDKELDIVHLIDAADNTIPLSKTSKERLMALEAWCKTRTRPANKHELKVSTAKIGGRSIE